jgi:hypothetical protein
VLSLAMSEDEGESWKRIGVLRGGKAPGLRFSYPWMLQMGCKVRPRRPSVSNRSMGVQEGRGVYLRPGPLQ